MSENFKELFEQSLKQTEMRIGKIIEATVVSIDKEFAMIDAGLKSESFIPVSSLKNSNGELEVAAGDRINVVLEALDNSCGETRLSRDKAKKIELWDRIEKLSKITKQFLVKSLITFVVVTLWMLKV